MRITIELTDEQIDAIVLQRMGLEGSRKGSKALSGQGSGRSREELETIRTWLRNQDIQVSDRGRIAQKYLDLYEQNVVK